jgi:hypothetical protein
MPEEIALHGGLGQAGGGADADNQPVTAHAGGRTWHRLPGEAWAEFERRVRADARGADWVVFDGAGL